MKIERVPLDKLAELIAGLVKQGLTFVVQPGRYADEWTINLTGGF